jgi:arylformamidase
MPVWPGEPAVRVRLHRRRPRVSTIRMGSHAGTHVDAPAHCLEGSRAIDSFPIHAGVGPAFVLEVGCDARQALLRIPAGCHRLLLRVGPSSPSAGGVVDAGMAKGLAGRGLILLGIDAASIAPAEGGAQAHEVLLGGGTWILEGLDLSHAPGGWYDLLCLPLRVTGGDAAPARALLRPRAA